MDNNQIYLLCLHPARTVDGKSAHYFCFTIAAIGLRVVGILEEYAIERIRMPIYWQYIIPGIGTIYRFRCISIVERACRVLKMQYDIIKTSSCLNSLHTHHSEESLHRCLLLIGETHRGCGQNNEDYGTDAKERDDGFGFTEQANKGHQEGRE